MSNESLLFDNHLISLKFLARYCGISLESRRRGLKNKFRDRSVCLLNFFWLNSDLLGAMYWFIDALSNGNSIVGLTYTGPCITLSFMANIKCFFFVRHEDEINEIIDDLKALEVVNVTRNKDEQKIIEEETKFLALVIRMSNILNVILMINFALSPLILILYKYMKTTELNLILPFLIMYPFNAHDIRIWPFVYLHQIWSECIVIMNVCAADYLFYICCTFLRIQFRLLHYSFENLLKVKYNPLELVQMNLDELVKRHQKLIQLANMLEMVYTKSTLYNFVSSSILICLTGFNVTAIEDSAFVVTFLVFLSSCLLQIFLLCFFGDMLMRSSMEIGDAVYKSKWYDTYPIVSKNLRLVQTRAQEPCKLTASGFADVNLRAFMKILSTAWSYFALLKTIYSTLRT